MKHLQHCLKALCLSFALAMILTGCGGGGEDDTEAATTTNASTPGATTDAPAPENAKPEPGFDTAPGMPPKDPNKIEP